MFKNNISTVISSLLRSGSPVAIGWFIVAVVVFPVYLQALFISGSHVGNEVVGIKPAFAYLNAATAIAMVFAVFWVCASSNHSSPYFEKWFAPASVRFSRFYTKATATLRSAFFEVIYAYKNDGTTALTLNFYKRFFINYFVMFKNCKTSKDVAGGQFFKSGSAHGSLSNSYPLNHSFTLS